jgi:flagellar motor switch protein FliM
VAVTTGSLDTTAGKRGRQANVVPFDFRRPNKFSRDHVRAFQIVHETFARQLSTVLATTLRSGAQCTLGTVEQLTYDEYVRSLPNPSYLIVLSLSPLPGAAILQFPLPIVFAAIDRLLGGTGDSLSPKRPLTEIESNLMRSVVDRTLRELEYAYETLVRVEAEIVQQEFNPQFAQIAAPSDMAMVVSFDTRIGEKHGNATICVPFSTMQPVLESLASQSLFQDHRGQDPVLWQQQLERALARVSVQTCVRFADVELSSAEIVGLQVGDIVPLDHPIELPVTISVDGVSCNRAVIGRRGKRLACLVVDGDQEHSA